MHDRGDADGAQDERVEGDRDREADAELGDIALAHEGERQGKVWIRLFPDKPVTKKPAETRMGKGKGAPEQWVAVIRPGKILFEMEGVDATMAREAMRLAAQKLPINTKFVMREQMAAQTEAAAE